MLSVVHHDLDVVRWAAIQVDVSGIDHADDVVAAAKRRIEEEAKGAGERLLAIRVEVSGSCKAHTAIASEPNRWVNELRSAASDALGEAVWVEKVKLRTGAAVDLGELERGGGPLGGLLATLRGITPDSPDLDSVREAMEELRKKVPDGAVDDSLDLSRTETLSEVIEDVRQLLLPRLLSARGDE